MSKYDFTVSISPIDALNRVRENENADIVHEEVHDVGNGRFIGTLVFEKYFMRVNNRVALVVIIDNIYGNTNVRVIATASSQGFIFNFDWGASEDFAYSIEDILRDYIIR